MCWINSEFPHRFISAEIWKKRNLQHNCELNSGIIFCVIWFLKIFAVLSLSLARISNRNLLIWTIFEKWSGTAVWIFWRFMDPSEVGSEWKFGDIVPHRIAWSTLLHSLYSTSLNSQQWKKENMFKCLRRVFSGCNNVLIRNSIFPISWNVLGMHCAVQSLHFIQLWGCHRTMCQ